MNSRLKDCATQDWQSDISSTNKLYTYCTYKSLLVSEKYLVCISDINYKTALAKVRCSSHNLRIETGRRDKIERCERLCIFCQKFGFYDVEDEYHFLFSCTLSANLISTILGNIVFTDIETKKFYLTSLYKVQSTFFWLIAFSYVPEWNFVVHSKKTPVDAC